MKGVAFLHVGHPLIVFEINHKTVLRVRMSISYLELIVFAFRKKCSQRSQDTVHHAN